MKMKETIEHNGRTYTRLKVGDVLSEGDFLDSREFGFGMQKVKTFGKVMSGSGYEPFYREQKNEKTSAPIDVLKLPRVTSGMSPEQILEMRLWSARVTMTGWVGDWSTDQSLAWLYGVIVGWDDEALEEIAVLHGWNAEVVMRLRTLMPKESG